MKNLRYITAALLFFTTAPGDESLAETHKPAKHTAAVPTPIGPGANPAAAKAKAPVSKKAHAAKPSKPNKDSAPEDIGRDEAIRRANAFFNFSPVLSADFVQIGADGRRAEGKLYYQRAGRVRFEYAEPATMEVIGDGAQLIVRDRKLKTQSAYFIEQTPLKFLLKDKIDVEHDTKLVDVTTDDAGTAISIEDAATLGGVSHVKFVFDSKTFKLKQWQITDPQGYKTLVSLFNIDQMRTPDPALFRFDDTNKSN